MKVIRRKDVARKLFAEKAIHYTDRSGGYTRIIRLGQRPGDNASMAIIELVARTVKPVGKKASAKAAKKSPLAAAREAVSKKPAKKPVARTEKAPKVPKAEKKGPPAAAKKPAKGGKKGESK